MVQDIVDHSLQIVGMITKDEVYPVPDIIGNPAMRFWRRRSEKYVTLALPGKVAEVLSKRLLSTIKDKPKKQEILDVGTGPLNFAVAYSQKAAIDLPESEVKIVAIDHKIEQFEKTANERCKELELTNIEMDFNGMARLASWRDRFDVVAFNMVLPVHSAMIRPSLQPNRFLRNSIQALRPGGKVAISYYEGNFLNSIFESIEQAYNKHQRYFWRAITQLFSLSELQSLLTSEGLMVEDSGTEPVKADDLKSGENLFEFLLCSQTAADFSFIRCPKAIQDRLRKSVCDAFEKTFRKQKRFEVSFPINFVVASKQA